MVAQATINESANETVFIISSFDFGKLRFDNIGLGLPFTHKYLHDVKSAS